MNAIILAKGEKSERLKKEKSSIMFYHKTITEIIIEKISDLFSKIFIVSIVPEKFSDYKSKKVKIIKDDIACGPLGGMYTGLKYSRLGWNFVVACDLPFINKNFVSFMAEKTSSDCDVVVPMHSGYVECLCAFYNRRVISVINQLIKQEKYQIREVLKRVNVKYLKDNELVNFGSPELLFFNVNTLMDLKKARKIVEKCPNYLS